MEGYKDISGKTIQAVRCEWDICCSKVDRRLAGKRLHNNGKDKAETGRYVIYMCYSDA